MDLPIPYEELDEIDQERLIGSMHDLMSAFAEVYGPQTGHDLWESFADVFGADLRNGLLMAMLTGQLMYGGSVRIRGPHNRANYNKVSAIKAIRSQSKLGLKEAKDLVEQADQEDTIVGVKLTNGTRRELISKLKDVGVYAY